METTVTPTDTTITISIEHGRLSYSVSVSDPLYADAGTELASAWRGQKVEWAAGEGVANWAVIMEKDVPFAGRRAFMSSGPTGGKVVTGETYEAVKYWVVAVDTNGNVLVDDPILVIRDQT